MSRMRYLINDEDLNRWYNIIGVDRDPSRKNPGKRYEESDLSYLSPYNEFPKMQTNFTYNGSYMDVGSEYQYFLTKLCEMCEGENPSIEERLNQQFYHKTYLGILRTISHLNLIPEDSDNWSLYFMRHDYILCVAMHLMNIMTTTGVEELYRLIKEKQTRKILNSYSRYGVLALLVYLAMNPNCDLPDYQIFESGDSCALSDSNLVNLIAQNPYSVTNYDVDEPPFDISIIGLKRHPVLPLFMKDKNRMSVLSEKQASELFSHYQNPFERVSIQKIKSLTNKEI